MKKENLCSLLKNNTYPGRGIVIGRTGDGKNAVIAYFIMGRSENSRNRVFVPFEEGIKTRAFDESKLTDPSLIIYSPVRVFGNKTIVTNGDQTDTVYDFILKGKTFEQALDTREFEPDAPNFTPRISGIVELSDGGFSYKMNILKADEQNKTACIRNTFAYACPSSGEGRFIHTYIGDGNPIPSFEGEPERVEIDGDIDSFTSGMWKSINADNKVSLFVRFINLSDGTTATRIINKNN